VAEFLRERLGATLGWLEKYASQRARPVSNSWPPPGAEPGRGVDRLVSWLSWYAEWEKRNHPRWRYGGMAEVVLALGRNFERGETPKKRGGWHRTPGTCYRNAYLNVEVDPARYVYVEGYVWSKSGAIQHGWFIDRQAPQWALDTTPHHEEDRIYYGIPLQIEYVRQRVRDQCWQMGGVGSILEGGPWPKGGPPIYSGAHPPGMFREQL
jgi:hypothetical protein